MNSKHSLLGGKRFRWLEIRCWQSNGSTHQSAEVKIIEKGGTRKYIVRLQEEICCSWLFSEPFGDISGGICNDVSGSLGDGTVLAHCVQLAELVIHTESGVPTIGTLLSRSLCGFQSVGHSQMLNHKSTFSIYTNINNLSSFSLFTKCEKRLS